MGRLLLAGLVVVGISGSQVGQVLSSSAAPAHPTAPIAPLYVADFETGDFSQVVSQQKVRDEAITLTTTNPLDDTYTALVKAGPGDVGFGGLSNVRAELFFARLADRVFGGGSLEGRTTWVTWEQKLDPHFEIGGWAVITQFAGGGSPVFAIEADGPAPGRLLGVVRGGPVNGNTRSVTLQKPLPRGARLRFKVYHRWSTGSSGRVMVWLNGALKATIKGPNLYTGYESTPYHKAGIYRSRDQAATRESRVKIDDVRWWSSDPDSVVRVGPVPNAPARAPSRR